MPRKIIIDIKVKILSLSLLVTLSGCVNNNYEVPSSSNNHFKALGAYKGTIVSSGIRNKSLTNIVKTKDKKLVGTYYFMENSNKVNGELDQCYWQSAMQLKCKWHDKYGTGNLLMTFNKNYTAFNGTWNLKDDKSVYLWTGSK